MNVSMTRAVINVAILGLVALMISGCRAKVIRRTILGDAKRTSSEEQEAVADVPSENIELDDLQITAKPNYAIQKITNVKYGEGLSHTSWNSQQSEVVDLLLDIYLPDDGGNRARPVVVFIHGGTIVHGTNDLTVPYRAAEQIVALYEETGVPYALHPLEGAGHGAWRKEVNGKRLPELAFEFVIKMQELPVVE